MVFNSFFGKGQLCLWLSLLIGFSSCSVLSGSNESISLGNWEMYVLVDAGYRLEALDGQEITIVQRNEVGEPLGYRLVMRSKNGFYMDGLRKKLLVTEASQVSLVKRND